jgi:hypothetical protein
MEKYTINRRVLSIGERFFPHSEKNTYSLRYFVLDPANRQHFATKLKCKLYYIVPSNESR